MIYKKNTLLFAILNVAAFKLLTTEGAPYVISDDRARNLDITPVLGRGYSIGTNSFQSTCLIVNGVTSPSYNYDYTFTDFSEKKDRDGSFEYEMGGHLSYTFGYSQVKAKVDLKMKGKRTNIVQTSERMIVATMRIERYYSSVREELSSLSDDSLTLLDRQDYIGFFKSCGPNYIRSIRRAQEITAIFEFEETSDSKASEFAASLQITKKHVGNKPQRDTNYIGCFRDKSNRALPVRKGMNMSVRQCAHACRGYTYFGRQWKGECWCGNSGYDKHGEEPRGCDCDGRHVGNWRNCVYSHIQKKTSHDVTYKRSNKSTSTEKTLIISILGYGLGLGTEGASTLVATNLEQYQEVMKFAFRSFTQNEDSYNIGMVYGFELVPWVDNPSFQVASKIMDEEVLIALPRSMIPKVYVTAAARANPEPVWANTATQRPKFRCKSTRLHKDVYGYCCGVDELWNTEEQEYREEAQNISISDRICRPARSLDKSIVKNNMSNNAEFVAHLDSLIRFKLNTLFTLEKCIGTVRSFPSEADYYLLKHQDTVYQPDILEREFTVKEMKLALDPLNNFSMLKALGEELDEFVDMYYQPCIAALFGMNIGSNPDVEAQYFLAYSWLSHSACMKVSCLADNMRWDRTNGGCTSSLIMGNTATTYSGTDTYCTKDNSNERGDIGVEKCKYDEQELINLQNSHNNCFACGVNPAFFLKQFCMPQITDEIAGQTTRDRVNNLETICDWHDNPSKHWNPSDIVTNIDCDQSIGWWY